MESVKIGSVGLGRLGYEHAKNLAASIPGCVLHADKIPKYHIPGHRSYIHSVKQGSYDRTEQGNPHHDSIL